MSEIIPAISMGAFKATPTGLDLPAGKVSIDRWLLFGRKLREIQAAFRWAVGDWIVYGDQHYGEMHTQAFTLWNDYSESSMSAMRRTSLAFPYLRRRKLVSWSCHAELRTLPVEEQEHWLDELETGMTRAELRLEMSETSPADKHPCPECGQEHVISPDPNYND